MNANCRLNPLSEKQEQKSSEKSQPYDSVSHDASSTDSRLSPHTLTRRLPKSSTPNSSLSREADGPPVKRAKTFSVLDSSSDEDTSVSEEFAPPKLSKFLSSQTVLDNHDSQISTGNYLGYWSKTLKNEMRKICQRSFKKVMRISKIYYIQVWLRVMLNL